MEINMKASGIGGQAVIEGIMMRNKDKYAIAVRKPDKEIELVVKECKTLTEKYKWLNAPVIRGIFNFVDSLVMGVSTINYSASFYDDSDELEQTKVDEIGKSIFKDKLESVLMAGTVVLSVLMAIALFMLLPYFASRLMSSFVSSTLVLNFFEGVIRVIIFLLYLLLISCLNDIKRTYAYHGAEHKCINCIESGARLTPENVKNSSRLHKRCGTSFMFLVMFISVIFFIFIRVDNTVLQIILRVLLIPLISGVSYEVIRWAGKNEGQLVDVISAPGMWIQKLTTKEPDMDMIEVAIAAVEAVFDWEAFLNEFHAEADDIESAITEAERVLEAESIEQGRNITTEYNQEEFNRRFEESDESESAFIDAELPEMKHVDDEDDVLAGFEFEDDSIEYNMIGNENGQGINPLSGEVYRELQPEAEFDEKRNPLDTEKVLADAENELSEETHKKISEELSEEEVMEGFEFVEDNFESDIYADDVPVFKKRNKQ